jgi:ADP-ribosyl-[dinitrogen reductase] hydrolase
MSATLLGGAIGDALGMPFETYLVNNPLLVGWDGKTFLPSEHHGLKAGQWTDDSQMSILVAESLIKNNGFNPDDLAKRYEEWFFSGTARGWGKTTMMAVTNLQNGKHWSESGIAGSLGNGTAMRAAPFGIYFRNDLKALVSLVKMRKLELLRLHWLPLMQLMEMPMIY